MIDYSWTECSSACIRALCEFRNIYSDYKTNEINVALNEGIKFIKSQQKKDGSWEGAWGVCFTYGTWFGVEALVAFNSEDKSSIDNACKFLINNQNEDGGWGESYQSCVTGSYVPHEKSQVVNTSWALLTLMAADYSDDLPIRKGVNLLKHRQLKNGDWEQEGISGVFNKNCMITYTAYRNIFPIWALSRFAKNYMQ